jgi:hypothetical protein
MPHRPLPKSVADPQLLLIVGGFSPFIAVGLITGPQRQVVAQELHDQRRVLVRFFVECIEFGNGVVERLLGNLAGLVGRVEDF